MKLARAQLIAQELLGHFGSHNELIATAGSIRRRKPNVKDIEIVYVPIVDVIPVTLFGDTEKFDRVETKIHHMINSGHLTWDDQVKRRGPKYKRLIHCKSQAVVELFRADRANWGLQLALRTGPAKFNHILVTQRHYKGAMPRHVRMHSGYLWIDGNRIDTPDEMTFFHTLDVPVWPPEERTADRLREYLESHRTDNDY